MYINTKHKQPEMIHFTFANDVNDTIVGQNILINNGSIVDCRTQEVLLAYRTRSSNIKSFLHSLHTSVLCAAILSKQSLQPGIVLLIAANVGGVHGGIGKSQITASQSS
jgi:hypothetical protein